jgi:hypothetical protein
MGDKRVSSFSHLTWIETINLSNYFVVRVCLCCSLSTLSLLSSKFPLTTLPALRNPHDVCRLLSRCGTTFFETDTVSSQISAKLLQVSRSPNAAAFLELQFFEILMSSVSSQRSRSLVHLFFLSLLLFSPSPIVASVLSIDQPFFIPIFRELFRHLPLTQHVVLSTSQFRRYNFPLSNQKAELFAISRKLVHFSSKYIYAPREFYHLFTILYFRLLFRYSVWTFLLFPFYSCVFLYSSPL